MNKTSTILFYITFLLQTAFIFAQVNPSDGCTGIPTLPSNGAGPCTTPNNYLLPASFSNGGLIESSCVLGERNNRDDGWYQFTATESDIQIEASGNLAFGVAIWSSCGAGATELACAYQRTAAGGSLTLTYAATIGTTYFVQIHRRTGNQNNSSGDLSGTICLTESPNPMVPGAPSIIPTACNTATHNITQSSNFFDDGGPGGILCNNNNNSSSGNYLNGSCTTTTTICAPPGLGIRADFAVFAMYNTVSVFDWMRIYDNSSASGSTLFDNGTGGINNASNGGTGSGYGDCGNDIPPSNFCSSSSCLTFEFFATGAVNRAGWEAGIRIIALDGNCTILLDNDLIQFSAEKMSNQVELNWYVEAENNISHYLIERSEDGINWEIIQEVKAKNLLKKSTYTTVDEDPLGNISYYRLVRVSNTLEKNYSHIKSVEWENTAIRTISIYPNPAQDLLTISGATVTADNFKVFNPLGQELTQQVSLQSACNHQALLNTRNLPKGYYILQLPNGVRQFAITR